MITDLTMPEMTGLDLAEEISALRPGMPVVLCTGFGHKFTDEDATKACIQAVIKKPMSKRNLAETLRKVLSKGNGSPKRE